MPPGLAASSRGGASGRGARAVAAALAWALAWALALGTLPVLSSRASADPPALVARIEALGPAREGEEPLFEQLRGALATAEAAAAEGDSARAERHRDLADALVRRVAARRRIAELRRLLSEREAAVAAARARLARAREAQAQAAAEDARLDEGAP